MTKYSQLNLYEREEISRGLSQGLSLRRVLNLLNRSTSTISRELKRNQHGREEYRANQAQIRASHLSHKARRKAKLKDNTLEAITPDMLKKQTWKNKEFRHYDLNSKTPRLYNGKTHFVNQSIDYIRKTRS